MTARIITARECLDMPYLQIVDQNTMVQTEARPSGMDLAYNIVL